MAETDEEARRYALEGCYGRYFREFNLPLFRDWDLIHLHKDDLDEPDSDVDLDYLCDRWLVGSVETVTRKLERAAAGARRLRPPAGARHGLHRDRDAWYESMRLLAEEVVPNVTASAVPA